MTEIKDKLITAEALKAKHDYDEKTYLKSPQTYTTYSELKALRDSAKLIPGQFYRITDYQCTTTQEATRAMDNQFDIIVQALSTSTLSENASADYHIDRLPEGITVRSAVTESENTLIQGSVVPYYYEFVDFEGAGAGEGEHEGGVIEDYHASDIFIAYDYLENNNGVVVPVIYKTDETGLNPDAEDFNDEFEGPDYEDAFYYVGTQTIDGVKYDKWRKINEGTSPWGIDGKIYCYTNVITDIPAGESAAFESGNSLSPSAANIPAWELKYSLDNDETRFAWADVENGRGVIYYMKDEWNNECPYDFKNIMFKRKISLKNEYPQYDNVVGQDTWLYTFTVYNKDYTNYYDLSIEAGKQVEAANQTGYHKCSGNKISSRQVNSSRRLSLPNNVFINHFSNQDQFTVTCYNNVFGTECTNNTCEQNCYANTIGNNCKDLILGPYCCYNSFGNDCNRIILSREGYVRYNNFAAGISFLNLVGKTSGNSSHWLQNVNVCLGVSNTLNQRTLTVERDGAPAVFEAPGTTHIILD